jgi:disease resistance protein RPM1
MAAAGIAISVSMGAMKPILEKLAMLLGDKYKKLKGLRKEVSFLMEELSDMKALLENMDNAEDELNSLAKKWRKDIIDMSYDIEDCIDNFMDRVGDADDKVGILKKASHYLRTIKDRYRIANQINEIKTRVIEASKRRERYNLNVCTSSSTTKVAVDPRLYALYKDSTTLVGIDTQKEDLVKWVEDEEKQLKVMSIVGFGGLGKTTLANEVYHEVKGHFNSNAFVPVSQKPDVPRLLSSVCSKLGLSAYSHACEVEELIGTLREYLHDKRYSFFLICTNEYFNGNKFNLNRQLTLPLQLNLTPSSQLSMRAN